MYALSAGNGISLVADPGFAGKKPARIRTVQAGKDIKIVHKDDTILIQNERQDFDIVGGTYVSVSQRPGQIVINNAIRGANGVGEDIFSHGIVKKIEIKGATVESCRDTLSFDPQIRSHSGEGCSLISNNKIKKLNFQGFIVTETDESVKIKSVKGDRGERGPIGPRGEPGARGECGLPGKAGETGPRGPEGPRGTTGATGPPGKEGSDGKPGVNGQKGACGPVGPEGRRGEKGEKGDRGSDGEKGEAGEKGEKGERGQNGIQGPIGPRGPQGEKGEMGKCDTKTITSTICDFLKSANMKMAMTDDHLIINTPHTNCGQRGTLVRSDQKIKSIICDGSIEMLEKSDAIHLSCKKLEERLARLEARLEKSKK